MLGSRFIKLLLLYTIWSLLACLVAASRPTGESLRYHYRFTYSHDHWTCYATVKIRITKLENSWHPRVELIRRGNLRPRCTNTDHGAGNSHGRLRTIVGNAISSNIKTTIHKVVEPDHSGGLGRLAHFKIQLDQAPINTLPSTNNRPQRRYNKYGGYKEDDGSGQARVPRVETADTIPALHPSVIWVINPDGTPQHVQGLAGGATAFTRIREKGDS